MPDNDLSKQSSPPPACSVRPKYRQFLVRPIMDGAAAWVAFSLMTALMTCAPGSAGANPGGFAGLERAATPAAINAVGEPGPAPIIEIATTSAPTNPDAVYRRTSASAAWTLLGVALSILAAVNLTIFRHLKRAYAPSKRRNGKKPLSSTRDHSGY